ncbi:MAG: hypothetical protein ACOCUT_00215 [bacterium]
MDIIFIICIMLGSFLFGSLLTMLALIFWDKKPTITMENMLNVIHSARSYERNISRLQNKHTMQKEK